MSIVALPSLHRPRRLAWLGAAAVLAAVTAVAVRVVTLPGSSAPVRPELQRVLDGLVTGSGRIAPGATAYVAGPKGTWSGSAGVADTTTGERMSAGARMRLESVSKAWTATLVLQLAAEGKLRLDDTVERRLPGLLPRGGEITVRQLLNHTSGLADRNDVGADPAAAVARVEDPALRAEMLRMWPRILADPSLRFPPTFWVRVVAALPLLSEPGAQYHYSNVGYEIAGLIAAKVAGEPLAALYERRIIRPLGLATAAYDPQGEIAGPHARGYLVQVNGALLDTTAWHGGIGAEGGIVADARDEARFLTALMTGRLLPPVQLAALERPTPAAGTYGLGLLADSTPCGRAYQHNGGGAGFKTSVFVSGDGSRVAVLLLNGSTVDAGGDAAVYEAARRLFCAA